MNVVTLLLLRGVLISGSSAVSRPRPPGGAAAPSYPPRAAANAKRANPCPCASLSDSDAQCEPWATERYDSIVVLIGIQQCSSLRGAGYAIRSELSKLSALQCVGHRAAHGTHTDVDIVDV